MPFLTIINALRHWFLSHYPASSGSNKRSSTWHHHRSWAMHEIASLSLLLQRLSGLLVSSLDTTSGSAKEVFSSFQNEPVMPIEANSLSFRQWLHRGRWAGQFSARVHLERRAPRNRAGGELWTVVADMFWELCAGVLSWKGTVRARVLSWEGTVRARVLSWEGTVRARVLSWEGNTAEILPENLCLFISVDAPILAWNVLQIGNITSVWQAIHAAN